MSTPSLPPELIGGVSLTALLLILSLLRPLRRQRRRGTGYYALGLMAVAALLVLALSYQNVLWGLLGQLP